MQISFVFLAAALAAAVSGAPQSSNQPSVTEVAGLVRRAPAESLSKELKENKQQKCWFGGGIPCSDTFGFRFGDFNINSFQFGQSRFAFPPLYQTFSSVGFNNNIGSCFSALALFGNAVGGYSNNWVTGLPLSTFYPSFDVFCRSFNSWIVQASSFNSLSWGVISPYVQYLGSFIGNVQSLFNRINTTWGWPSFSGSYSGWGQFRTNWDSFMGLCNGWGFNAVNYGRQYSYDFNSFSSFGLSTSAFASQRSTFASSTLGRTFRD